MLSLYSKKCEYLLRGLAQVVGLGCEAKFRAIDFCDEIDLPEAFTRKALQELVRAGILKAIQGPGGGYSFARPVEKISVLDVILAIEGKRHFSGCVMGFHECHAANPCALHGLWNESKEKLLQELADQTLASLKSGRQTYVRRRRRK